MSRDGVPVFQKSILGRHAREGEIAALLRAAEPPTRPTESP